MEEAKSAPLFSICGEHRAKIFNIYDGDSAYIMFPFHGQLTAFKARMSHIDTAEMRTRCSREKQMALLARTTARALLDQQILHVTADGFDKYGRVLVEIQLPGEGTYHEYMLRHHLAYPYEGKTKTLPPDHEAAQVCPECKGSGRRRNCIKWGILLDRLKIRADPA